MKLGLGERDDLFSWDPRRFLCYRIECFDLSYKDLTSFQKRSLVNWVQSSWKKSDLDAEKLLMLKNFVLDFPFQDIRSALTLAEVWWCFRWSIRHADCQESSLWVSLLWHRKSCMMWKVQICRPKAMPALHHIKKICDFFQPCLFHCAFWQMPLVIQKGLIISVLNKIDPDYSIWIPVLKS